MTSLNEMYTQILSEMIAPEHEFDWNDIWNSIESVAYGKKRFTVQTIRKNDSKTEPNKKAGNIMIMTGSLGPCQASLAAAQTSNPNQAGTVQFEKNKILRMCVTHVDRVSYLGKPPAQRTRAFSADLGDVAYIRAGGRTFSNPNYKGRVVESVLSDEDDKQQEME